MICGSIFLSSAQTDEASAFKAGAAKVNITPVLSELSGNDTPSSNPMGGGYNRINDSLYTRAIVIDNGSASAALISVDNGMLSDAMWKNITEGIKEETGIPAENVILCATHTHSAPFLTFNTDDQGLSAYISHIEKAVVEVVKQAKSNMQPARIGFGKGTSYLNVNRDVIDPETRLWTQGPNYKGISDHSVDVVKIEAADGKLISVFINFAVHANMMYMSGAISAGIPGGVTNYIEEYYKNFQDNGNVIALWSMGAAGDQNPVDFGPIMGDAARLKTDAAYARQAQMLKSVGQIMGEEIIRVLNLTKKLDDKISIYGAQETVTCPGRKRTDTNNRQGKPGTYVDGDPVNIRLSLLKLGNIAFAGVDAEIYDLIGLRVKEGSPLSHTIFTTITNGAANSGYIPNDAAFGRYTFQVLSSRLKPGCAEESIVNGLLDMIDEAK